MSSKTPSSQPVETLRSVGYRVTPQRQAILQMLEASDRPLNVGDILARLEGYRSGVPTVYRNLQQFTDQGWIEPIIGPDQAIRYVR